jgi:hypothetical protein
MLVIAGEVTAAAGADVGADGITCCCDDLVFDRSRTLPAFVRYVK